MEKCEKLRSIISTTKLKNILFENNKENDLKIFDCTFPSYKGINVYKNFRIKGAKYMSFEEFKSNEIIDSEHLSLGFPSKKQIHNFLNRNKIKKTDQIILYDQYGIYSSPRAWFILKTFSIKNIFILDGGLPLWIKNKFPLDKENIDFEDFEIFDEANETINKKQINESIIIILF